MEDKNILKDLQLSKWGGVEAEALIVQSSLAWDAQGLHIWSGEGRCRRSHRKACLLKQCFINSTVSHPQHSISGAGWSSSCPAATGTCVHPGLSVRSAAGRAERLDCVISSLHADHCSLLQSCFSACHELPVLGIVMRHKSCDAGGRKSLSFFFPFPWLLPFLRLWPPPAGPWKKGNQSPPRRKWKP